MARCLPHPMVFSLLLIAGVASGQRYVPPPPPLTVDPCAVKANPNVPVAVDPKAKPVVCPPPAAPAQPAGTAQPAQGGQQPAADKFPFPGSAPAATTVKPSAADQFPYPGSQPDSKAAPPATVPNAPAPAKAGSAADQFPYPGETSKSPDAVPEGNTPRYVPDAPATGATAPGSKADSGGGSSSSSNSSGDSSSSSSSSDALPASGDDRDKAALPPGDSADPVRRGRRPLPKVPAKSADERVTDDLNVAKFYSGRGNYQAAYLRSKDATKLMPEDAESHFSLAEAAQKLQKKDEAVAEYTLYLKLDPSGDKMAAAQRALTELR